MSNTGIQDSELDLETLPTLPREWRWIVAADLCSTIASGSTPKSDKMYSGSGDIPFIKVYNLTHNGRLDFSVKPTFIDRETHKGLLARSRVFPGDVLINIVGPPLGKVSLVPDDFPEWNMNQAVVLFRPTNRINNRFLAYALLTKSVMHRVTSLAKATAGQHNIGVNMCRNLLPLPVPPLPEQQRIVSKIEELFSDLDAGVSALERAKANVKRYRASVLKAAVEGRLTADWRAAHPAIEPATELLHRIITTRRQTWEADQLAEYERKEKKPPAGWQSKYSEPIKPETKPLSKVPESWTWATVEQCSSFESNAIIDGPFGSNLKTEHYTDSGPQVIRLNNIGEGEFKEAESHISSEHFETLTKHSVNADDVIIAMLGETLPRACLVPVHIPPAIVKADCARFSTFRDLLLPKYATYVLNSFPTRQRVSTLITGVGRPRINLGKTRSIPIPLPPIDEQREIVIRVEQLFSAIDHSEKLITVNLQRASRLRQSILKRAFEGNLFHDVAELV